MALLKSLFGRKKKTKPTTPQASPPSKDDSGSALPPSAQRGIVPLGTQLTLQDRLWLQSFLPALEGGELPVELKPSKSIRILRIVDDPNATGDALGEAIQSDPALAAEVLKLANSSLFGGAAMPLDLGQAIVRVGNRQLRMLLMSIMLKEKVTRTKLVRAFADLAWRHCMFVAVLASNIARPAQLVPEAAYMAGLFHNVGVLALLATIDTYHRGQGGEPPSPQAILEVLDNHAYEANRPVVADWNFPPDVEQAIRRYKTYKGSGNPVPLAAVVALANDTCRHHGLWTCQRDLDLPNHPALAILGVEPKVIPSKKSLLRVAQGLERL